MLFRSMIKDRSEGEPNTITQLQADNRMHIANGVALNKELERVKELGLGIADQLEECRSQFAAMILNLKEVER